MKKRMLILLLISSMAFVEAQAQQAPEAFINDVAIHASVNFLSIAGTKTGSGANGADTYYQSKLKPTTGTALLSGTQLCRMVKDQFPHIQVLILSMYNNATAVQEAIFAEADGYILKNAGRDELLKAVHRITNGGTYFSQDIVPIIYNQYHKQKTQNEQISHLSAREKEILGLIVKELTSEEIAEKLFISKKTVDNHRANILVKTQCRSTIGLVKFAIKSGLIE